MDVKQKQKIGVLSMSDGSLVITRVTMAPCLMGPPGECLRVCQHSLLLVDSVIFAIRMKSQFFTQRKQRLGL